MVRIRVMGQAGVRVTIRVMQGSGLQSRSCVQGQGQESKVRVRSQRSGSWARVRVRVRVGRLEVRSQEPRLMSGSGVRSQT